MNKIILVDKEKDYTSRDVVNIMSKIFNTKKVGHFGTLDPLATGLLVIGIGSCTKIDNLLKYDTKEYTCEVLVGRSTNTYDITGETIKEQNDFSLDKEQLNKALKSFEKTYEQEVPIYSAVKVNGKKLYEYARNNINVSLPKKKITIYNINLIDLYQIDNYTYFNFSCKVSKGTYIRSLINDLSKELNIPLCMNNLRRTRQDIFDIKDAYTLTNIENNKCKLLDIEDVFDVKKISIPKELEVKIINGSLIENVYSKDLVIFTKDNKNYVLYQTYIKDKTKMKPYLFF